VQPPLAETPSLAETTRAAQVQDALADADAAYRSGNALPSAADNAFDSYRKALRLDPDNANARAGIDRIVADAEQRVSTAITAQDAPRARIALARLQQIAPTHPRLDALQTELVALARKSPPLPIKVAARPSTEPAPVPKPQLRTTPVQATPNLDLAKAYLAANQLVEPIDASALGQLRRARAAGENRSAVQIAATDLGTRILNRALAAINASDFVEATRAYSAAVSLDREFETSLPDLDAIGARLHDLELATQRATVVGDRLARAMKLRTSGQLTEPVGNNAYETLKQILMEGASTPEIRNEQQRLSFALLENTRTALAARDIDRADVLASRAEEILPGLPQTKILREQIGAARAERDERNAVLQAASLPRRREVPAVYPRDALLNNVEGWVDLEFVISADGVPTNIAVKDARPSRVFDTAATQALRQWRFEPIVRNGAQQMRRATLRMEFKLKG
jgi:TonB family protein